MRTTIARAAAAVALVSWSCSTAVTPPPASDATFFTGARVIVGDGTVIENAAFVVQGQRIAVVGARERVTPPAGATRIDLTGKTVMPAIIDAHNHLGYANVRTGTTSWDNYTREHLIENLERMAYYGVGMSMSLGNDGGHGDVPFRLRDELLRNAAQLRTAGPGISTPGGGQGGERARSWTTVRSAEEARIAVRTLAPSKPNGIKIWVDDRDRPGSAMSREIQRAIISEAHLFNIMVYGHANYLRHVKELIANGVDVLTHMVRDLDSEVDVQLIRLMRARMGLAILPVLPPPGDDDPGYVDADLSWIGETLPPSQIARMREALARPGQDGGGERYTRGARSFNVQARNLIRLRDSGAVRIGFGTDGTGGWSAHTELADMVRAGLTPMEVIVAATGSNAIILAEWDYGTIRATQLADFIVLDANPLDAITNTRRIHKVYLRGTEVDRAAIRAKLSAEPTS